MGYQGVRGLGQSKRRVSHIIGHSRGNGNPGSSILEDGYPPLPMAAGAGPTYCGYDGVGVSARLRRHDELFENAAVLTRDS